MQIWPDGATSHGVVRAFALTKGSESWSCWLGLKDHVNLIPKVSGRRVEVWSSKPGNRKLWDSDISGLVQFSERDAAHLLVHVAA